MRLPLFATLRDHLVVDDDLGAHDLGLGALKLEGFIKKRVVLEWFPVDVINELSCLLIKVDSSLDATDLVFKSDRHD